MAVKAICGKDEESEAGKNYVIIIGIRGKANDRCQFKFFIWQFHATISIILYNKLINISSAFNDDLSHVPQIIFYWRQSELYVRKGIGY